jgi:hypothetical protein
MLFTAHSRLTLRPRGRQITAVASQIEFYVRRFFRWIWRAGLLCLAVGGFVPLAAPPKNRPALSPAFDLFLYQALLFSISGLCLYYFRLYGAPRFRARTRRSAKGPTAQTGTAEHCWPQAHSSVKPHPPHSAQQPCTLGPQTVYKIQINGRIFGSLVSGNRPCAISCGRCLGLSIWWRWVPHERLHVSLTKCSLPSTPFWGTARRDITPRLFALLHGES